MKKLLKILLMTILAIGVSSAVVSLIPIDKNIERKPSLEKQYDFDSIEGFETYCQNKIMSEDSPYNEVLMNQIDETFSMDPITLSNEEMFAYLLKNNVSLIEDIFLYLDDDILIAKGSNFETWIANLDDEHFGKIEIENNEIKSIDVNDYTNDGTYGAKNAAEAWFVLLNIFGTFDKGDITRNEKFYVHDYNIEKLKYTVVGATYEYETVQYETNEQGENVEIRDWGSSESILGLANININFETTKINIGQEIYDVVQAGLKEKNVTLTEHLKSHIQVIEDNAI